MALGLFIISWKKSAAEAYQRMLPVLSLVPGEILHETIWDVSSDLYGCPAVKQIDNIDSFILYMYIVL